MRTVDPAACLVVDCLSLWVANLLAAAGSAAIEHAVAAAADAAAARPGTTIVVTTEVGLGIVPATPLGREYRDLLGRANAIWAERAEEAYLVVAGRLLPLLAASEVLAHGR
jgi:adenosyl cobinamide kinase/adenosyl cobinamide phosphate guanylyltransferase